LAVLKAGQLAHHLVGKMVDWTVVLKVAMLVESWADYLVERTAASKADHSERPKAEMMVGSMVVNLADQLADK
jgi:hypothetical protein